MRSKPIKHPLHFINRTIVLLLCMSVLSMSIALSEASANPFSIEAIDEYCTVWNGFFLQKGKKLSTTYFEAEDGKNLNAVMISYNNDHENLLQSSVIPGNSYISIMFDTKTNAFGVTVIFEEKAIELEKAVFYLEDAAPISAISHTDQAEKSTVWTLIFSGSELLSLSYAESIDVILTVDGERKLCTITMRDWSFLYEMVDWMAGALSFSDTTGDLYKSKELYPGNPGNPEKDKTDSYSFREDLDGIDEAAHSVFYIDTFNKNKEHVGQASGFVAFDEHLLITNQHVIRDAYYCLIEDEDGNQFVLDKVIMSDKVRDVAILLFPEGYQYKSLELNGNDELKRGQPVVAIGNPIGYKGTVSYGNISAFPVMQAFGNLKCIQFTAPTSQGSSGGCLFDDQGKVIGVTSAGGIDEMGVAGNDIGCSSQQKLDTKFQKFDN